MERIRRYLERTPRTENVVESSPATAGLCYGRLYDAKSIGSLSQRFFESDEDERYYGTCNGYTSQPGSKSNLLLCSECDQKTRTCTYRPRTPGSYIDRYVEERLDPTGTELARLRADRKTPPSTRSSPRSSPRSTQDRREMHPTTPTSLRDFERIATRDTRSSPGEHRSDESREKTREETTRELTLERRRYKKERGEGEDSPDCELCQENGRILVRCEHCDFSTEGDLICFRCQSDESSSTNGNNGYSRCERTARMGIEEEEEEEEEERDEDEEDEIGRRKYPIDALVKIKLNDRAIEVVDSDDTNDSDPSIDRQRGQIDRLDTIVEAKGDTTASENDEDNGGGAKLNGTTSARLLNYMIVLFL